MSTPTVDVNQNGNVKTEDTLCTLAEFEECDFSKLLEKPPRILNMERQRSLDERSLSDLSIGISPRLSARATDINTSRIFEPLDFICSPVGRRSGFNTPRSQTGFEPHPMVAEAWDALRRSLVYFRGQPVGTIAALDNSEEKLNYDQVNTLFPCNSILEPISVQLAYTLFGSLCREDYIIELEMGVTCEKFQSMS